MTGSATGSGSLKLTPHRGEDYVAFRSRIDAKLREISELFAA